MRAGFHQHSSDANSTEKFSIEINTDVQDMVVLKTFGLPHEMQMPNSHLNPWKHRDYVFEYLRICDHKPHTTALDPGILLFPGQVFNHRDSIRRISPVQTPAALPQAQMPCTESNAVQCPPPSVQLLPWPRVASVWKCFKIIVAELSLGMWSRTANVHPNFTSHHIFVQMTGDILLFTLHSSSPF